MSVPEDLARALAFAAAVKKSLPIDEELDRRITRLLHESRPADYQPRTLKRRTP